MSINVNADFIAKRTEARLDAADAYYEDICKLRQKLSSLKLATHSPYVFGQAWLLIQHMTDEEIMGVCNLDSELTLGYTVRKNFILTGEWKNWEVE